MGNAATIRYEELYLVFVSNFYDHPLSGLCLYKGALCKFEWPYEDDYVTVHSMSLGERLVARFRQKMFEWFVGDHWTYVDGKERYAEFGARKPEWLSRLLFKMYYKMF
jgi:hypothetical protein